MHHFGLAPVLSVFVHRSSHEVDHRYAGDFHRVLESQEEAFAGSTSGAISRRFFPVKGYRSLGNLKQIPASQHG